MNISKLKIVWKWLTGGIGSVADYLLDVLNDALAKVDGNNRQKVQAALNIANRVLSTLMAIQWLCPTKWQTAYSSTLIAVGDVVGALQDLKVEMHELEKLRDRFAIAVEAWKSPDDETCVDCID